MPNKKDDETPKEFIDRCMSDDETKKTFPDTQQRLAFCISKSKASFIDKIEARIEYGNNES